MGKLLQPEVEEVHKGPFYRIHTNLNMVNRMAVITFM